MWRPCTPTSSSQTGAATAALPTTQMPKLLLSFFFLALQHALPYQGCDWLDSQTDTLHVHLHMSPLLRPCLRPYLQPYLQVGIRQGFGKKNLLRLTTSLCKQLCQPCANQQRHGMLCTSEQQVMSCSSHAHCHRLQLPPPSPFSPSIWPQAKGKLTLTMSCPCIMCSGIVFSFMSRRLQPSAIVTDEQCAACDFNNPGKTCLRPMEWVWRGEHYSATSAEYNSIKAQLASESFPPQLAGGPVRSVPPHPPTPFVPFLAPCFPFPPVLPAAVQCPAS